MADHVVVGKRRKFILALSNTKMWARLRRLLFLITKISTPAHVLLGFVKRLGFVSLFLRD